MAYNLNDQPLTPVTIDILTEEDLSAYTSANVRLFDPTGAVHDTITGLDVIDDTVTFEFPTALNLAGVWNAQIQLILDDAVRANLDPAAFVVEPAFTVGSWHTLASARAAWVQAPLDDLILFRLLEESVIECTAYAPPLAVGDPVPENYRVAEIMQARNTLNSDQVAPSGDMGDGTQVMQPKPLDWKIRQILRPKRVARIG